MPSRNKKNKNRAQQPTTSGTSATKNEATSVEMSKDLGPSNEPNEPESKPKDLKSTISVAKEKLDQLQQTVDSIKASISQANVEKTDEKPSDDGGKEQDDKAEQPFETQTMKKKRNRNRNRNRNKNSQSNTTDESGMSSTSGTNENSTHENSPTHAVLTTIVLPTSDVITSKITEEPTLVDCNERKGDNDHNDADNVVIESPTETIQAVEIQSSPKIDEIRTEAIESETQIGESSVKIEACTTVESEKEAPIETPTPGESEPASKQDEKTSETSGQVAKHSDKRTKDNEKQKKNTRQTKDNNKNSKEMPKADAEPQNQDGEKVNDSGDHLEKKDAIETKEDLPDVKQVSAEPKNKNNKTVKENKKSPKMNKKNQPTESNPIETEQKKSAEPRDVESTPVAKKKIDGDESALIQKIEQPKEAAVESEQSSSKFTEQPTHSEQQLEQPIEQIPLPSDEHQTENISQGSNIDEQKPEVGSASKQDVVVEEQTTIEPEIKEEIQEEAKEAKVEENKRETKQQTTEAKPKKSPSGSPKESKKAKGKKSPPQTKGQNGQKQNNAKEITSETKPEPIPEKNDQKSSDEPPSKDIAATEPSKEVKLNDPPKELPTKREEEPVKIEASSEETIANKLEEAPNVKDTKPTLNLETTKGGSTSAVLEPTASTSNVPPKIETEPKKSNLTVGPSNDAVTKTPSTTPVLTTPATEASKKPTPPEDEAAKIWQILEEASKSLEPVEIEMPTMNSTPEVTAQVMCLSKDEQQVKEETHEIVTILEAKEPIKAKQGTPPKAPKTKENIQQPKQSSPTKTVEPQPKKAIDPKKKQQPTSKNTKPNKASQPQTSATPDKTTEKMPEKTPENTTTVAETPPIEVSNEAIAVPAEEVPLDVSIIPNEIEVAELNADSKNVQGSDFVPSVEQSVAETKSLVPENDVKVVEVVQLMPSKDSKSKSKSPINVKKEKTHNQAKALPTTSENVQETKEMVLKGENNNETAENTVELPTESTKSQSKSPSKSMSPEKSKETVQNNKQKEANAKSAQVKTTQNNKKTNGKPFVPPKPDNLVSSQTKKAQVATTKSESAVKSKTEKILVLTGNIEDDDSEDDYIEYKFMPRQVFISTICQACKKPTTSSERILCQLCQMVSYCCAEHGANDEPIHKDLCAALQEIAKKRGGHIYNNARILNNNDYRSLRVHTLNLCENFLKRPLETYEREILLFPRLCSTPTCREWRQNLLTDCPGCGQVFYCTSQPEHLVESHQRWCKSVALYQKLVVTQSVSGRIEPSLPSRIQAKPYTLPNNIGDVFKDLYKNYSAIKDDCVFATLTQLATAPLTAYFATQKAGQQIGEKFTIHLIGAELQFEADVLDIWETFFLHLAHNLMELTIVFCGPELNAENIPLDIISRIRMCRTCRQNCRIVKFDFQCAKFYHDYANSSAYSKPDLICFFNPGFHHINSLNGLDTWSETIKIASSSGCPVVVTSYTEFESPRDLNRFQGESTNGGKQMRLIHGPEFNVYSSQRPERNFISDEIVPLIFKNYFCFIMK